MAAIKRGGAATIRMMLWMLSLAGAIYLSMLFVGRDHGQLRQGLASQTPLTIRFPDLSEPTPPTAPTQAATASPSTASTPSAPATAPEPAAPAAQATASSMPVLPQIGVTAEVTLTPAPLLQEGESLGAAMVVTARGAVVREGPGIQFKLVGRLTKGADVQLVDQPTQLVGWSVIQFKDGNGVVKQGYVASKLLGKKH